MQTQFAYEEVMPTEPNNPDGKLFLSWLESMDWDRHGGIAIAAEALGKSPMQISRYKDGANLPKDTLLAMSALAEDLEPWGERVPIFEVKLSLSRRKRGSKKK